MWQAERVKSLLEVTLPNQPVEIVIIHTRGDKILDKPYVQVGGKGIFTKEIEDALLAGEIDFAVHSFKDLPAVQPEGLDIVCIPERDSPYDALFSTSVSRLSDLPEAPTLATGSPRRRAQLLALRPQATILDLRGNVNTRLKKFHESEWDGMIMAHAAIRRMGWEERIAGPIAIEEMLPAAAQGALAIEARTDDQATREALDAIHNKQTAISVTAERAFLANLEGSCHIPIAAYGQVNDATLHLEGMLASLDGDPLIRQRIDGPIEEAQRLGTELAESIKQAGGQAIIERLTQPESQQ